MHRACFITLSILMLTGCLNLSLMVSVANPFASDATPTQEVLPSATPSGYIGYITPKSVNVNVRGGPGMTYPIVQTLHTGESLPVLHLNAAGWYQVEITAQGQGLATAWVSGNVVTFRPS